MNTRLNVLLLCADDHRADALGGPTHPILHTPHLRALIENGSHFPRTYTTVPVCTPARGEILSGCSAMQNGVRWFNQTLNSDLPLLPQTLGEAGYQTFFTGKWHNDGGRQSRYERTRRVFNGGMMSHQMRFEEDPAPVIGFSSELFAEAACDFLGEQHTRPWFCHVAFTSPHDPRTPPDGFRPDPRSVPIPPNFMPEHPFDNGDMTIRDEQLEAWPRTPQAIQEHLADYYGMIEHQDAQIGRILQALEASGQADNTLVIYTSDHGLAIGSHGLMGKENLYEHSVRVPLILRGPGIPRAKAFEVLCYARDLFATICGLTGVPAPRHELLESRDLKAVLCGLEFHHRDAIYCVYRDAMRMAVTQRYKLILYPEGKRQLFDVMSDPHETCDLLQAWRYRSNEWYRAPEALDPYENIARDLNERLLAWQTQIGAPLTETL